MIRRLITTLTLWTCLLGITQPTLACGPCSDCCPRGFPSDPFGQLAGQAAAANDCCAAKPTLAALPQAVAQPRKAADQGTGSPALAGAAANIRVAHTRFRPTLPALADYRSNESLTYLRTARLRL